MCLEPSSFELLNCSAAPVECSVLQAILGRPRALTALAVGTAQCLHQLVGGWPQSCAARLALDLDVRILSHLHNQSRSNSSVNRFQVFLKTSIFLLPPCTLQQAPTSQQPSQDQPLSDPLELHRISGDVDGVTLGCAVLVGICRTRCTPSVFRRTRWPTLLYPTLRVEGCPCGHENCCPHRNFQLLPFSGTRDQRFPTSPCVLRSARSAPPLFAPQTRTGRNAVVVLIEDTSAPSSWPLPQNPDVPFSSSQSQSSTSSKPSDAVATSIV